jgi:molybdenum cofactor guanylyltransferase
VVDEAVRKAYLWTGRHHLVRMHFPDTPVDPIFNTNRPEDLDAAAAPLPRAGG